MKSHYSHRKFRGKLVTAFYVSPLPWDWRLFFLARGTPVDAPLFYLPLVCFHQTIMSGLRRSNRQRQPKIFFDDKVPHGNATQPTKAKKSPPELPTTRPVDDPPPSEVQELIDQPIPAYTPPIQVEFVPLMIHWMEDSPFSLFIKFLGEVSITTIMDATNTRATHSMGPHLKRMREWSPLTRGELFCWLGLLFYIANYTSKRKDE